MSDFPIFQRIGLKQHKNWIKTLALSFELEAAKKEAERIARIDILTGLYNRRAFYEIAPQYLSNAKRYQRPTSSENRIFWDDWVEKNLQFCFRKLTKTGRLQSLKGFEKKSSLWIFQDTISKTSSFGIVHDNSGNESIELLLKKADTALYKAKNHGRNQTVIYNDVNGASIHEKD
nr:GGDEF domain-containing protein [uncultured Desulfobacter sp.]